MTTHMYCKNITNYIQTHYQNQKANNAVVLRREIKQNTHNVIKKRHAL